MSIATVAGLHIGSVEACAANEIKVLLAHDAPQDVAFNAGRPQGFPRLNGYLLIPNEGGTVVGVISKMTMEAAATPSRRASSDVVRLPSSQRRIYVTPLGTIESLKERQTQQLTFQLSRGVTSYPAVGDSVLLPTSDQLRAIVEAHGINRRVQIGRARLALDAPVTIDPDKLFGRHVGVFGNTGSGKSCTVAGLIRWCVEAAAAVRSPTNARFIVLDPNGEYRDCFLDLQNNIDVRVFSAEPRDNESPLHLPGWLWNGQEWASALGAAPGTQRPVLMQAIRHLRASAIAGEPEADTTSATIRLSAQVQAQIEWLQGCRAQGAAAIFVFPKSRDVHRNLRFFEETLEAFKRDFGGSSVIQDAIDGVLLVSTDARQRRTEVYRGEDRTQGFADGDLAGIADKLVELRSALPTAGAVNATSEDRPSSFELKSLPEMIDLLASHQAGNMLQHMAGLDLRIRTLLADARVMPIIAPEEPNLTLASWLRDYFGSDDSERGQITVLDLSLVPSDILPTIVSVFARLIFETTQRFRRMNGNTIPTVIVLEEAHNFVQRPGPAGEETSQETRCRHIFEKIAKEGRKFGVGLVLSSQRPAELSSTVVAQCNSFILHRIVNDRDQELVGKLAPDSAGGLLMDLPSLPTQHAILLGLASEIPLVFETNALPKEHRPSSDHPDYWDVWTGVRALDRNWNSLGDTWARS